jgi:nucleoid DNA-binding protein
MEAGMNEEALRRQIERAVRRGEASLREQPRAKAVDFLDQERMLVLELQDGTVVRIPVDELQVLTRAAPEDIKDVEIAEGGLALHWDRLDVHFTVPGIVKGLRGTAAWMKAIGKKGGQAKSENKRQAARVNGRRGGRPRKEEVESDVSKGGTLTKRALIGQIAADTGMKESDVRAVVDGMLRRVKDSVNDGIKVQLSGFGDFELSERFELRERKARSGVRPGTTRRIEVPPRGLPVFVPSEREFGPKRTKK